MDQFELFDDDDFDTFFNQTVDEEMDLNNKKSQNEYKNCKKYRFENLKIFNNTKVKLFDFYFLSKSKNILCMDSDIIFLNEPKTIIEITHRYKYTSSPHEENVYTTTSYEPTLEEAIKVLQKHFTENKELFQECFEMQLKLPFEVKKAKLDGEIAFKAAKNFLDNLIKE